ncbi:MAG: AraC family transcriptional regulator [Clostridiales Family XIII bacterium]|jgi:AraC-like DNA-binding protein|nr:AraC family transcriptional regulator [Clostridiales Family XIII bacterium]
MDQALLQYLRRISEEEKLILEGNMDVEKSIYSNTKEFIVDSKKMLRARQLIDVRPHTRFVHFPRHSHNYIEIVYMCNGSTTHIVNGVAEITLKQGELLFLNQNASHEIKPCKEEDICVNFIVLPEFFDQAFTMIEGVGMIYSFVFANKNNPEGEISYLHFNTSDILPVQNLTENMIWSIVNKHTYTHSINQVTMGLLILHMLNNTDKISQNDPNQYKNNIILNVLKYIEESYKTARLEEFASDIGMPLYYLSKLIKKHTGSNFKQLLQQKRLEKSIQLLSQSQMPVENIVTSVGYENSSYFHKLFKEKYKTTPHYYRKQAAPPPHLSSFATATTGGENSSEIASNLPSRWE